VDVERQCRPDRVLSTRKAHRTTSISSTLSCLSRFHHTAHAMPIDVS
jgi:hypothetical protein